MAAKQKKKVPPAVLAPWFEEKMREIAREEKAESQDCSWLDREMEGRKRELIRLGMEAERDKEREVAKIKEDLDGEQRWWAMQTDHEEKMRALYLARMASLAQAAKVVCATSTVMAMGSVFSAVLADSFAIGLMCLAFAGVGFSSFAAYQHYNNP